ncbi:FtsK/SpoIIIE domain-containing protein [Amycolatopsis aidingensis]|uniref:FtsK/SpoIIIE domain-containing protein n=1 Tax=Amycolatopsis aidingensis TaxID=2842453 RepID=UPI001C0E4864|nr:FtsK/SpoIIIE domain-containing protein [Amycolatopsis aidingensis]
MNTRESRWVDPAPLEIARPRLPWWTLLPGWVKLVCLPVALVWVLVWLLALLGRMVWRYPLLVLAALVTAWFDAIAGHWAVGGTVAGLTVGLAVWWRVHPESFWRVAGPARSEIRQLAVYAADWRSVMRLSDLVKLVRGREHRPKLGRVRSEGWRDRVRVRMVKGQAPEQWEAHASGLAHAFKATSCRVRVRKPGRLELDFIHRDPLQRPIPAPALPEDAASVDLKRLPVGRTETGKLWRLRLLARHLLVVGVSGAGKGSLLWAIIRALAPMIRTGEVRLYGIDPKGGMELGQAPEVFGNRVVFDNGPDAVALLEDIATEVKTRASRYRGWLRSWQASTGDPFVLLVVDELADVIAYQPDKTLRERASRAVQTITSQGRAPGVCVLGLVQDPRKEVVGFRHLFTTRIAMRLDEKQQVDMVLGDGVRERGATAHEISEQTPGVAWAKEDGRREPFRARAFHVTDDDLDELVTTVTGVPTHRAQVLSFPERSERDGGAVA